MLFFLTAKVPPQRQHPTQTSHIVTSTPMVSSHTEGAPTSYPQPQPAHCTPVTQVQSHVPTQTLSQAHTQATSMFMSQYNRSAPIVTTAAVNSVSQAETRGS